VNFRALPQLKKEITGRSKMVVGVVAMQVWEFWLAQHTRIDAGLHQLKEVLMRDCMKYLAPDHMVAFKGKKAGDFI